MKTEKIFTKNATYQKFEVLKTNRNKRYKYYEFFVEGVRNINVAIQNGWQISSLLYTRETPLSHWAESVLESTKTEVNYELTAALMGELSGKQDTSELLAVMKMRDDRFSALKLSETPLLALFDRPSNHGNLGTIIRSCDSLGIEGLILTGHGVDLYEPDVISSSMGSFFHVPVIRCMDNAALFSFVEECRVNYPGFQMVGTTAHHEKNISKVNLKLPTMLLIGNETDGLAKAFKEKADILATIPMSSNSSASSFNVGCAATVLFYEAIRQRADMY